MSSTASVQKKLLDYARDYAVEKISIKLDKAREKQRARTLARETTGGTSASSDGGDDNLNIYYVPTRNSPMKKKQNIPGNADQSDSDSSTDEQDNSNNNRSATMKLMDQNQMNSNFGRYERRKRQQSVSISDKRSQSRNMVTTTRNFRSVTSQAMRQFSSRSLDNLDEDDEDDAYLSAEESVIEPAKFIGTNYEYSKVSAGNERNCRSCAF